MNLCSFTGFLTKDPELTHQEGVSRVEFVLVTYTYRTAKSTGEKSRIPTFIRCEAWHTGADTICNMFEKGSKIHIHASAKNLHKENHEVIFRVNEFDSADNQTEGY